MTRRLIGLALLAVVAVACGSDGSGDAARSVPSGAGAEATTSTTAAGAPTSDQVDPTTTTTEAAWVVGGEPLPLRPDGLGEIAPTPEALQDRRLATEDLLPPPPDDDYHSTVEPLGADVIERMGRTWTDGCPVPLDDLRRVTVTFWGFDDEHHTGELIVHRDVADDVAWVFGQLDAARFPLEQVALVTSADLGAAPTGDGNVTAAFVCRPVRGGSSFSAHASGLAIDVNPFVNPYVRGDVVIPELARAYLDRGWRRPGMIQPDDVVTESFAAVGWTWGGTWSEPDFMHFSATGR